MSTVTARGVESELRSVKLAPDVRRNLAARVGLDARYVPEAETGIRTWFSRHRNSHLRRVVTLALKSLDEWKPDEVGFLRKIRVYFETQMGWEIANNPDKQRELRKAVHDILIQADELTEKEVLGPDDLSTCWQLDADFHATFCRVSGHEQLATVVDLVKEKCHKLGRARSRDDVCATVEEHREIVASILAKSPDLERIFRAVSDHVRNGSVRWQNDTDLLSLEAQELAKRTVAEGQEQMQDLPLSAQETLIASIKFAVVHACRTYGAPVDWIVCDRIRESLVTQFRYPGCYVVFLEDHFSTNGKSRLRWRIRYHSSDWGKICRYVEGQPRNERALLQTEYQPPPVATDA